MPLKDVTVTIDLAKPAGLVGFGKPLIIGSKAGGSAFKNYSDLASVAADFAEGTEEHKAASALFGQGEFSPKTIAIVAYDTVDENADHLTVLQSVFDEDWYFLIATTTTQADVLALANYVEGKGQKMFATRTSSDTDLAAYKAADLDRTFVLYHSSATEVGKYPEAAWVGAAGSRTVGSITWKFKQLIGILPDTLTAAELLDIHTDCGNAYVTKAGDNVTSEGKVLSGEYIDVIMAKDWIKSNIETSVQTLLNRNPKIPYTNAGISLLEGVVRGVLQTGFTQGIIADDDDGIPLYSTNFPTREETTAADRSDRILRDGRFSFDLAGAVHEATIRGTITV